MIFGHALPVLLLAAGCGQVSSALDSAGPQAQSIEELWWLFFWICLAVYIAVLIWLGYALLHRRATEMAGPTAHPGERSERRARRGLTVWVGGTVVILFMLSLASYWTDHRLATMLGQEALTIEVTANQWWWQVHYADPDPSRSFITANEIYVPVGTPIKLSLRSQDVIHSFWVPNLHGKQDLIPGRQNEMVFSIAHEGVYRGQCAEFCGLQHANMAIEIIALPPDTFETWRAAQLQPAAEPSDEQRRQGRDVFLNSACVMCHSIRGTSAAGRTAPDLTHVASRRTIAAGTLPMNRGNLGAWIADPQRPKPGNHMPIVGMSAADFQNLLAYLDGLK